RANRGETPGVLGCRLLLERRMVAHEVLEAVARCETQLVTGRRQDHRLDRPSRETSRMSRRVFTRRPSSRKIAEVVLGARQVCEAHHQVGDPTLLPALVRKLSPA